MTMTDLITSISALVAALSFVYGINAWRREFIGKRNMELAETVLALFYEAEDAIREIRSPFSFGGEGTTRKKAEKETQEGSQFLDQAYVAFERYHKREKLFAELRSMKYRVMAAFGEKTNEPFDEITKILNEILASAHILGTYYWPRQGRTHMDEDKFAKHLEEMHKHEEVFWFTDEQDKIGSRVHKAVQKMELITKKASDMR